MNHNQEAIKVLNNEEIIVFYEDSLIKGFINQDLFTMLRKAIETNNKLEEDKPPIVINWYRLTRENFINNLKENN